jgi:hypothetical protein
MKGEVIMEFPIVFDKIFQYLGILTSIISFPYTFIIAKKSFDVKYEKNKTNIIEKLLFFIGNENEIDSIQILSIIKSISRNNNIDEKKILPSEIIEDLINFVIGNPIFSEQRKIEINNKLKKVLTEYLHYQGYQGSINDNDEDLKKYFASSNFYKYVKEKHIRFVKNIMINFMIISITLLFIIFLLMHIFHEQDYYFFNLFLITLPIIFMGIIIYYTLNKKKNNST